MALPPLQPCPCCGHRTFIGEPPGTWEICPVCFWEDTPASRDPEESNGVSLVEAQSNYARIGSCAERWKSEVRAATPDEAPPADWKTIEQRRPIVAAQLERSLEAAFGSVRREGGVTLHQSHVLDDYGTGQQLAEAARRDPEERWQDVADDKLSQLDGAFVFLDARGFRFYVPAYLRLFARALAPGRGRVPGLGMWWYSLDGSDYHQTTHYALLDTAQREAIAVFLLAVREVGAPDAARDAAAYLETYWARFAPGHGTS